MSTTGQKISFSPEILSTKEDEIIMVREIWKSYIQDCIKSFITKDKGLLLKYWNDEELKNGYSDIIMDNLSSTVPLYLYGELVTFDIKKTENGFFRIRSLILASDSLSKSVFGIFSIYAKNENNGYKLYNSFNIKKSQLKHYSTQHLDYYYPLDYDFSIEKATEAESFYSMFSTQYDYHPKNKITYVVGNTVDEANGILGFDYSLRTSTSKNAGYYLSNQSVLISCQVNHEHEIVHSIIESKFPNLPLLFNEGIATYYAGTRGEKFYFHIKQLKDIINSKPESDLSNFEQWHTINSEFKTDPFYTIGAIFIDYALRIGGTQKVLALFKYSNSNEDIYLAISSELGIERDKIDSFLKEYITNYSKQGNLN